MGQSKGLKGPSKARHSMAANATLHVFHLRALFGFDSWKSKSRSACGGRRGNLSFSLQQQPSRVRAVFLLPRHRSASLRKNEKRASEDRKAQLVEKATVKTKDCSPCGTARMLSKRGMDPLSSETRRKRGLYINVHLLHQSWIAPMVKARATEEVRWQEYTIDATLTLNKREGCDTYVSSLPHRSSEAAPSLRATLVAHLRNDKRRERGRKRE